MTRPTPLTGAILAGGRATRLGGIPKGLERIGDRRMLDVVADALRTVIDDLVLVANAPEAETWLPGTRVLRDVVPNAGALGGLHAALARAGPVLVVAWDMPFVSPALLRTILAASDGARAVLPLGADGPEPLCAYYAAECAAVAGRLLAAGERRARALAESLGAIHVPPPSDDRFADAALQLRSVNTPEEIARARTIASRDGLPR